jgi:hypothetical protein
MYIQYSQSIVCPLPNMQEARINHQTVNNSNIRYKASKINLLQKGL